MGWQDINTNLWGLSEKGYGQIAAGIDLINQRIGILLRTSIGSAPLRPLFGSRIYQYADQPVNTAIPNIKQAITDAIESWLPDITIEKIEATVSTDSKIQFSVYYQLSDDDLKGVAAIGIQNGNIITQNPVLILRAYVPADYTALTVQLVRNGDIVYPLPPQYGFAGLDDMYDWVSANWGNYGRWFKSADAIYLYADSTLFSTGSLQITALDNVLYKASIPENAAFRIAININGVSTYSDDFDNVEDMLQWLPENWGNYGVWYVENIGLKPGEFNNDFNNDFNTRLIVVRRVVLSSSMAGIYNISADLV